MNIDPTIAQNIIVQTVGCSNGALNQFLQANIEALWCSVVDRSCTAEMKFYKVQLSAIETALAFVRNEIDKSQNSSSSTSTSESKSKSYSDSQGQSNSQGTSCSFTVATSLAQSRSDTVSDSQGTSSSASHGESQSTSVSWDRGNGTSNGFSNSFSNSVSNGFGDSLNTNVTNIIVHTESHTREDGPGPQVTYDPGFPNFQITPPFFNDNDLGDWYSAPGFANPPCVGFQCGPQGTLPNYGRWWDGSYNVEISTPLFDAGASWDTGANFDQVHVITTGCDESSTDFLTQGNSRAESVSDSIGQSVSHSEGQNQQDAHSRSDGSSDSRSDSFSASNSLSQGDNEGHSEADSEGRSESQSSGQSTAWGKNHSDSYSKSRSEGESASSSIMWSQIFSNLNDLWNRTFAEIKTREAIKDRKSQPVRMGHLPQVQFSRVQTGCVGLSGMCSTGVSKCVGVM